MIYLHGVVRQAYVRHASELRGYTLLLLRNSGQSAFGTPLPFGTLAEQIIPGALHWLHMIDFVKIYI